MMPAGGAVEGRLHLFIYIGVQTAIVIMMIVDLALNKWFHYCYWDFGLEHVEPIHAGAGYLDDDTIAELINDICDNSDSLYAWCPEFCSNADNFEGAGGAMIFFGVITLIAALAAIICHALALREKQFRHWIVWVWLSLPACFWLLGTIIYGSVTNLAGIDDVNKSHGDRDDHQYEPKNADPEAGLILCAFIVVFQVFLLLYALLTTRKNFARE